MSEEEVPPIVLVVDDDPTLRGLYETSLRDAGMSPRLSPDGKDAIAFLQREMPDAVVCDLAMPRSSGLAVIEALRGLPGGARVPVIVISGVSQTADLWKGVEKRWDRYLEKPARMPELIGLIRQLIAERRATPPPTAL